MQSITFWLDAARKVALPQSMLPALLAVCMSSQATGFSLPLALLAVVGVALAHLGMNLFDDYFDYRKKGAVGIRDELASAGFRARIGKCNYILEGKVTARQYLWASIVFCGLAVAAGVMIALFRGAAIGWFVLIGGFLGVFYSGYPIRFSYRGLGELLIGVIFGPLTMGGVCYAACGHQEASVWLVSIPIGLLVVNIVYTHAIMDYEPDKSIHKMTLAVLLGNKQWMLAVSALLVFTPYMIMVAGMFYTILPLSYLAVFLTLPLAIALYVRLVDFTRNETPDDTTPRFWMGPMENWERIRQAGIDWFMIRWMLARNLVSLFAIILAIASFFPSIYL
ncbi:MAG: prenyltransferase [Prevotellaceae bacterium]|jgi:1,4-dihydroxy-2-naphthoate octaprenyltransferase|nr:prenyltransferase [Prevotellaceae bacterium]